VENKKIKKYFRVNKVLLTDCSGQALIEAIAAIGIVVVGILGTLSFLSTSIGLNRIVTAQYAGTYIGASYVEQYKNCLDTKGWDSKNLCLDMGFLGVEDKIELNGTNFSIFYDDSSCESKDLGDKVRVCVTVKWKEKGDDFSLSVEDYFYNWR